MDERSSETARAAVSTKNRHVTTPFLLALIDKISFFAAMTFLRSLLALFTLGACFTLASQSNAATRHRTRVQAPKEAFRGAIVVDAETGKVLINDNADVVSPPASMTKLMTFAVLQDLIRKGTINLQTPVKVTAADSHIGGTRVWLKEGEVFPVGELLYAMLIQSANDAAYALANASAGSIEAFVQLMNEKARALGMTRTTFRSPHGLPPRDRRFADSDLTSPRDMATLARYLLLNTDILKYTSIRIRSFGPPERLKPVVMVNHNHLLQHVEGVDGMKTGYTGGAGFCLTATALRNGHRVIVVVMGSPDYRSRDARVIDLLNRGFAMIPADSPPFAANIPAPTPASDSPLQPAPLSKSDGGLSDASPVAAPASDSDSGPVITLTIPGTVAPAASHR